MTTTTCHRADTIANDASFGTTTWSTPSNATAPDDTYADCAAVALPTTSQYLKAQDFDFTIPSGATIDGIEVFIERNSTGMGTVTDARVRIVKADGSIGTTDKAAAGTWPTIDIGAAELYGSTSDLWGETWTDTDINDVDFGVVMAASVAANTVGHVDAICIQVSYTEADDVSSSSSSSSISSSSSSSLSSSSLSSSSSSSLSSSSSSSISSSSSSSVSSQSSSSSSLSSLSSSSSSSLSSSSSSSSSLSSSSSSSSSLSSSSSSSISSSSSCAPLVGGSVGGGWYCCCGLPKIVCNDCFDGTAPQYLRVDIAGISGGASCALINGSWLVEFQAAGFGANCAWACAYLIGGYSNVCNDAGTICWTILVEIVVSGGNYFLRVTLQATETFVGTTTMLFRKAFCAIPPNCNAFNNTPAHFLSEAGPVACTGAGGSVTVSAVNPNLSSLLCCPRAGCTDIQNFPRTVEVVIANAQLGASPCGNCSDLNGTYILTRTGPFASDCSPLMCSFYLAIAPAICTYDELLLMWLPGVLRWHVTFNRAAGNNCAIGPIFGTGLRFEGPAGAGCAWNGEVFTAVTSDAAVFGGCLGGTASGPPFATATVTVLS